MKRSLSILLAVLLSVSLIITGCSGSKPAAGDQKSTSTASTAAQTTAEKKAGVEVSKPNEFPIVKDKITLTVALPQHEAVTDYENNKLTKMVENKTNVKVNFMLLPTKEYKDKLNIMLNSGGQLPDIFFSCNFTNEQQAQYGTEKMIIPLNKLIDTQGFYIKDAFKQIEGSQQQITAPDGNIYSLPSFGANNPNKFAQRMWVVRDFLDALGMKKPTTTDEYYNYLKAVKTKDPNKNGKADEIGVTGANVGWWQNVEGFLMNPFVYDDATTQDGRNRLMIENDVIKASFAQPEFKEGLLWMNKLYKEGLLDGGAFTQDQNQLMQLVENKDAIVVGAVAAGGNHTFANATGERRTHYVTISPLKGPKGKQQTMFDKYNAVEPGDFSISKDCKYPEVAFKWGDYWLAPEMHTWGRYGEPEVDWQKPAQGAVAVNGGQAMYKEILKWGAPQASHWAANRLTWSRFGSDSREKSADPYELEWVLYNAYVDYKQYAPAQVVPPFFFNVEDGKKYSEFKNTINKYVSESVARFVTGDLDIEKNWDSYLKELDKMGLKDYLAMQQKEYDKTWKGK